MHHGIRRFVEARVAVICGHHVRPWLVRLYLAEGSHSVTILALALRVVL